MTVQAKSHLVRMVALFRPSAPICVSLQGLHGSYILVWAAILLPKITL
jgi:hypothetical protein